MQQPLSRERTTVLLLGEPVELLSYDSSRNRWTVIQLTKDSHISGVFGLGTYRLDALWKLGQSEATPSTYLRESLAEEFGVPIPYVLYNSSDTFAAWDTQATTTKAQQIFTYAQLLPFIRGRLERTMDPITFLRLIPRVQGMTEANLDRYVLRKDSGLVERKEPDGAVILRFDRQAFDTRTTTAFEELPIRREAKRIVVLNTTDRPAIGARVGRIVSKLGANVVAVGNDRESPVTSCQLSGTAEALATVTARRILDVFECESKPVADQGQGDLTIRVGETYANRYEVVER